MLTYDAVRAGAPRMGQNYLTHDGFTVDSAGAFLVHELERLDPTLHMPLASVTWGRDVDLREDVTIADDAASYTNSTFAAPGGITPAGINWGGKNTTTIAGIAVDIRKTSQPLLLWEMEIKYSIPELESAIKIGRPVDTQKVEGLNLKHQMDIDQVVYVGDPAVDFRGLFNSTQITASTAAATGSGSSTHWSTKTPANILADVNTLLQNTWASAGYAVIPDKILLPPAQYGLLLSQVVSDAGNISTLKFLEENNLTNQRGGTLEILPVKWAIGMGAGGTPQVLGTVDRAIAYSMDPLRVRYPMTPLQKTPIQYVGIYHTATYYCRLGQVEWVYPETASYLDGI
jgi:hypothetical protein